LYRLHCFGSASFSCLDHLDGSQIKIDGKKRKFEHCQESLI
jgi:hypothetical protein